MRQRPLMLLEMRAAVYTRISTDVTGEAAGVARQEKECRVLVEARGWDLAGVYCDNDRSAYTGKPRPEYERLLDDIETGDVTAIVAWHPDRLHRSPRELETFIDLIEDHGVAIATVQGGTYDLGTASGRMTARVVGAVSRHESEHKSERQKSKARELAEAGLPSGGGTRPFGYEADGVTIREDEAVLMKDAAHRLLAGGSLRSILREWEENGVRTVSGNRWSSGNFGRMIRSARIAGLRSYQRATIGKAVWPGIIAPEDHYALLALSAQNAARVKRAPRKYLLTSGLAVCGLCGANLVARPRGDGRRAYVCATGPGFHGCGKIRALADPLEGWVRDSVLEALDGPGLAAALADVDTEPTPQLTELEVLEESMKELSRDFYSDRVITRAEYFAARDALQEKIDGLADTIAAKAKARAARDLVGVDLRAEWEARDLSWRRGLVSLVVEQVVANAAVVGRNFFDPNRFEIRWRV